MSVQVTITTTDGRVLQGINYSINNTIPTDPVLLAATMQGGMSYGVYHLHTAQGWVYIPASQITGVQVQSGAVT